jgi:hypothetical protein
MSNHEITPDHFNYVASCCATAKPNAPLVKINFVHHVAIGEMIYSGGKEYRVAHVATMTDTEALPDPYGMRDGNSAQGYAHND